MPKPDGFQRLSLWRGQGQSPSLAGGVLRLLIKLYQIVVRPIAGLNCRFEPSCSDYALIAIDRHGAARGGGLAFRRVLRCNPWCSGGHDPVPPSSLQESPAAR